MNGQSDGEAPRTGPMPILGLGTWQNDDPAQCARSVGTALEIGYRHIDTAQGYGNEAAVGEGISEAISEGIVDRADLFVATKVWVDSLAYHDVLESAEASLDRLGVDSIDLMYVHWPARTYEPADTLPAFGELYDRGLIEHIGVSNFEPHHLEEARSTLDAPLFANQVEMHPLLQQAQLREYCADAGIELVAYSPLARGKVFDVPELQTVAERHGASPPQVALAWLREVGVTAIPKARGEAHIRENMRSLDVDLDTADRETIEKIDRETRRIEPSFAPETW